MKALAGIRFLFLSLILLTGCPGQTPHDRFHSYYEDAIGGDRSALTNLIRATKSRSYWNRYYGYMFLGNFIINYPEGYDLNKRTDLIEVLVRGLDDPDQAIRRVTVKRLHGAGTEGVERGFDMLVSFVSECRETDVAWFSAEALVMANTAAHIQQAVETLTKALKCNPLSEQRVLGAPQLRRFALRSLADLVKQGKASPEEILNYANQEITDHSFLAEVNLTLNQEPQPVGVGNRPPPR